MESVLGIGCLVCYQLCASRPKCLCRVCFHLIYRRARRSQWTSSPRSASKRGTPPPVTERPMGSPDCPPTTSAPRSSRVPVHQGTHSRTDTWQLLPLLTGTDAPNGAPQSRCQMGFCPPIEGTPTYLQAANLSGSEGRNIRCTLWVEVAVTM